MEIGSRKFVVNEAYKGRLRNLSNSQVLKSDWRNRYLNCLKKKKKKEFAKQIHMHDPPSSLV